MPQRNRSRPRASKYVAGSEGNFRPSDGFYSSSAKTTEIAMGLESMVDYPTPNFKKLQGSGVLVNTGMTFDSITADCVVANDYKVYNPVANTGYRRVNQFGAEMLRVDSMRAVDVNYVQGIADHLMTLASTEAFASVAEPDIDSMVSVAEARETLEFLASPLRKAGKLVSRFGNFAQAKARDLRNWNRAYYNWDRKGRKGAPPQLREREFVVGDIKASDIPSAWLAVRYGLMPLIYDIQGVMEAYERELGKIERKTYRAKRTQEGIISYETVSGPFAWGDRYYYTSTVNWSVTVRAGVLAEHEVTRNQTVGLHWSLLPAAAWEAATLSFVADWFANFGQWLRAITAEARASVKTSWVSFDWKMERTTVLTATATAPAVVQVSNVPTCVVVRRRKQRIPGAGSFVKVTTQFAMNTKRWADAAALISTNLLKGK